MKGIGRFARLALVPVAFGGAYVIFALVKADGTGRIPWEDIVGAGVMVVSVTALLVVFVVGIGIVGDWVRRETLLRRTRAPHILVPTLTTDDLQYWAQKAGFTQRRWPLGLTLTADVQGIRVWGGRVPKVEELLRIPWEKIRDIRPEGVSGQLGRGLAIEVEADVPIRALWFPVVGGFPLRVMRASDAQMRELVFELSAVRDEAMRLAGAD
ncbi:hypothetical protein SCB71_07235 [Herbiconiux sp. KACC 21604]|uniref:hypothetical protein n=1 Tax=unclassified Herbiconiux TaxID=2618217 RepID=UPI0014921963|nr:hypothetical protein [Herbiconiux sp. SALV-R1]QJU53084.1 hypothetical protein HL652_05210 [Herbiconiux sp. SALV-R1]WPO88018.1 hypothetical protein SCB71_07235 [Herbiconiux sp. KACC 21604]